MSVVKKSAKVGLYFLSFIVLIFVAVGVYTYVNMGSIAKQLTEDVASNALGVPVTIGDMDISVENKTIVAHNVLISNVDGYTKEHMMTVDKVSITVDEFSKNLLVFSHAQFDGVQVNVEVRPKGTNLGGLKKNIEERKSHKAHENTDELSGNHAKDMKVIVKEFMVTGAQINPSVTLVKGDLSPVSVSDITVSGVGEREGGLPAKEAIGRITKAVLIEVSKSASAEGFLKGLPLDTLNAIGVETIDVFKENLKESYKNEVREFKEGFKELKKIFE